MNFNDYTWHDAIIKNILVDRMHPGKEDTISYEIVWPNNNTSQVIFQDVYWAKMILGFGVIAEECILEAFIAPKDDLDLVSFRGKWKGLVSDNLFCYVIKTASTGSEMKIIAKRFKVIEK
ncbi:MAG: hypothetical protein AB2L24_23700 [Mangrovibacterium sp.]